MKKSLLIATLFFASCVHNTSNLNGGSSEEELIQVNAAVLFFMEQMEMSTSEVLRFVSNLDITMQDEMIIHRKRDGTEIEAWGVFNHTRNLYIIVKRRGGPGYDSLFHELLHMHLWLTTAKSDYSDADPEGRHSEMFYLMVDQLQTRWLEDHPEERKE